MKAYVVDSAAVRSNLQLLQTRAGSAVLWAVLKGDGYGLGLLPMEASQFGQSSQIAYPPAAMPPPTGGVDVQGNLAPDGQFP